MHLTAGATKKLSLMGDIIDEPMLLSYPRLPSPPSWTIKLWIFKSCHVDQHLFTKFKKNRGRSTPDREEHKNIPTNRRNAKSGKNVLDIGLNLIWLSDHFFKKSIFFIKLLSVFLSLRFCWSPSLCSWYFSTLSNQSVRALDSIAQKGRRQTSVLFHP